MCEAEECAPAKFRRAFFLFFAATLTAFSAAPPGSAPELGQVGKPNAAEAARILEQFRLSGIRGEYYLEFELHALPRQGDEQVFHGRMWGSRNDSGPITRVEVTDAQGK